MTLDFDHFLWGKMESKLEINEIMKLLHPLSADSKLEIISRLTKELKADVSIENKTTSDSADELYITQKDLDEKALLKEEIKEALLKTF
ncbi:hypothetical protein [Membranihabitans maritimus]|uniref:hypothetical protein n=1 Tax=Membranihabitans maritimus TaxID=2904244 RepID=UPI001F292936|nr:hypothetical protein [Membranihabitans maritimus]